MLKNLPLPQVFPSVKDVKRLPPTGPWPSKSGGELIVRLEPNDYGVWIPPFIMHTVIAREPNSGFLVVCNTLFEPNNPASHDSYPVEEFNHLRRELVKRLAKM